MLAWEEELEERRRWALAMGGEEKLRRRKSEGLLNARERIDRLVDAGSFSESGMFAASAFADARAKTPADGKITGVGRVDGRPVALVANDFTVLGASSSAVNMKKIRHMKKVATEQGLPLVFLGESSGARMPDRMGAVGRSMLGQDAAEFVRTRETPWVSALLGYGFGSSTWYTCLSDFAVMRRGSIMAVASSRVTSIAIGQPVDPEELGGWRLHSEVSGLADLVVDTDEQALAAVRTFLGYLPSHRREAPPTRAVPPDSGARMDEILKVMPAARNQVYDVRRIIDCMVDTASFFELKGGFARSLVTGLARIAGRTVGIVANNPQYKGGAIDPDACRKATSFLVLCDSFNVPLLFLVDQPGFLVGVAGERQAAPAKIVNWMHALQLCTVPKISVILRKDYGQAYLNMGGGRNSDEVIAWPMADLGFMDPQVAVHVLHGLRREDDPERFDRLADEVARDSSVWDLATLYEVQRVIDPRETRDVLIALLEVYQAKISGGVGQHLLSNWPTSY